MGAICKNKRSTTKQQQRQSAGLHSAGSMAHRASCALGQASSSSYLASQHKFAAPCQYQPVMATTGRRATLRLLLSHTFPDVKCPLPHPTSPHPLISFLSRTKRNPGLKGDRGGVSHPAWKDNLTGICPTPRVHVRPQGKARYSWNGAPYAPHGRAYHRAM
jgi:hypothetical protein